MPPKVTKVKILRTYIALGLMMIFCSYYAGISMFSHAHIANGSSIVHSHLGGGADHNHSDSQYAIIDILSNFQSECAVVSHGVDAPFCQLSESSVGYLASLHLSDARLAHTLRGPPQE